MSVAAAGSVERWTQSSPCPVCSGSQNQPRGKGQRCHGFRSTDGDYIHCTREEFAGSLSRHKSGETFAHRSCGECRCGFTHGKAVQQPVRPSSKPSAKPKRVYASLAELEQSFGRNLVSTHAYEETVDEERVTRYVVLRIQKGGGKKFLQASPQRGGWVFDMSGVKMIPYHLPELLDAIYAGDSIHIVEGEKDVEAVEAARGVATCNPMGAGKDVKQYAEYFEGAELIRVIADRDEVGRRHAQAWVDALQLIVPQVELLEAVEGKDAHDSLVTHGHSLETAFSRIQPEEPAATQAEHDEELFAPLQPFTLRYGPDFPTYTLPDNLREMVEHLAEAQQIPAAVVAPWMLGTVAACVARKFEASPRIGWDEPLNMFVIGALPPATRKSGTLRALAAPFTEHERKYNDEHRDEREAGEQLVRLMERRLAKAEKFHAEAGEDAEAEAFAKATVAREALSEARRAATGRLTLFTADMTPESAAALMEQNGERLACISGEGDEFFALMRRYSANGAVNQDAYLKFHSGDHHRVNRKNSATIDLEHPALTLVLAVQTSVVQSIRLDTELRERGMVARLLFAVPESTLGRRKIAAAPVPRDVEQRYAKMIAWLLDAHGDRVAIEFTDEADNLLRDFEAELEPKLGERGELASISDWAGKLAGLIVRVAGTLHCAVAANELQRPENSNISEETVARAIEIGRWALEHARVALGVAWENDPEAERVWHWVTSRAIPLAEFSARDAFDKSRGRNEKMAPTNQGLAGLVERGFLRQLPEPDSGRSGGRRRSPQYQVNPEALSLSSQAA